MSEFNNKTDEEENISIREEKKSDITEKKNIQPKKSSDNLKNKKQIRNEKSQDKRKKILIFFIIGVLLIASVSSVIFFSFQEKEDEGKKKIEEHDEILDSDNDGYPDNEDAFPFDSNEWIDTDKDGIGNNADPDDDNDGVADVIEDILGTNTTNPQDKPNEKDLENVTDIPTDYINITYEQKQGVIIYDETSENYKTKEKQNTGYLISTESKFRNSDNYNITKIILPEDFSNVLSGQFSILTDENGTYLVKSIPLNTTNATDKILEEISQFEFKNIETDFVSVGISYNHYTYGIGVNEDKEFIYVTLDDNPTFFTNVHVTGTVVPYDFFLKTAVINIDISKQLDEFKNIIDLKIDDKLPSFLIVDEMTYNSNVIKGDAYDVIRPGDVANLAENLSSDDISSFTDIARNITQQLIIMGDYNNEITDSTLWMILSPTDLDPTSLTGIVELNVAESDFSILTKRLEMSFSHNMDVPFKIKIAVTHDNEPSMPGVYQQREINELWNDIEASDKTMVESVKVNNFAMIVDVENLIDGLAESLELPIEEIKYIRAMTSFRNPGIGLLIDQNFTDSFEGNFEMLWNFSGLVILPDFKGYTSRAIESDSLLYHIQIDGVLYNLWNYLHIDNNFIKEMPLIIADSYSILEETETVTLSQLHNNKNEIIGDKTVSFLKVEGFLFGTSLKKVAVKVAEEVYPQISYLIKAIPIDIGFYDFTDFVVEDDKFKTYHVPVLTLEWGISDTALGNHTELEGFYISIDNAIQKGVDFSQGLLKNTEVGSKFNQYKSSILDSPYLLDILEKASEMPVQLLKGFFLATHYKEMNPELDTTIPPFYPADPLSNDDIKIHLEIEGIGIGTSLKSLMQESSDDIPVDVGVYMLFDRTKSNFPTYTPFYSVPMIFITEGMAPTYLGDNIKVNGIYIYSKAIRDSFVDTVNRYLEIDNTHPYNLLDQLSSIRKITDNVIRVFDGFIYVYDISEVTEDLSPPNLEIQKLETYESTWVVSDPYDDYEIPVGPKEIDGEWNFCYPFVKSTIHNTGGQSDIANVQFLLEYPSKKEININGTALTIPGGESRPGYATELLKDPEIGTYSVKAYLFKNGTFKEYIEDKTTTFKVKKSSGHLEVKDLIMHSWESNQITVNVTNTGSFETTYTVLAILIPNIFAGMDIDGDNYILPRLIEYKSTTSISPGNTAYIDFDITTRWSGGEIHFFLFNGTRSSMIDEIRNGLDDLVELLDDLTKPDSDDVIFNLINSIYNHIMLSHGVSLISFDKAEEIISAAVIKSSDYYYGDGSDYVTVTLNMTVQKSNYEFSDYVQDWLWDKRQMNVTIYKDTYYLNEDYRQLTLLDDFQLDPNTKNYEFDIDIGETFGGFGIYVFNVSLIVKDNNGDYRIVDEYEIQKSIWINISDVDIIDISPNVMPIDTDNNLLTVKIQNIGNITQKFDVYVYDENILSKKWLSALPLPAYTLKETSNTITPKSYATMNYYINSRFDSVNGSFKIYIEPNTAINDLDITYHKINVGPEIEFIEISNSSSSGSDDSRYLDNRGYYIYCDLTDGNQIKSANLIYDYDGELENDFKGTISMSQFSGNQYRSDSPIPKNASATKVTFRINATDNNIDSMFSLYDKSYSLWLDTSDYFNGARTLTLGNSWNESLGYSNDDWDVFKITSSSSQGVLFNLTHSVFSDFDLYFYNETYQILSYSNSNFILKPDEQIEWYFYPGATGTYYICVYYYDGIIKGPGNYTLSIKTGSVDAPKDYLKGFLVFDGTTVNGRLTPIIDTIDYYKIYLNIGQKLYVNMTSISTGSDFDLYLYNMTHNEKDSQSHHIPLNVNERASYTANIAGYYYIKVIYFIGLWGTYTLTFDVDG